MNTFRGLGWWIGFTIGCISKEKFVPAIEVAKESSSKVRTAITSASQKISQVASSAKREFLNGYNEVRYPPEVNFSREQLKGIELFLKFKDLGVPQEQFLALKETYQFTDEQFDYLNSLERSVDDESICDVPIDS